MPGITILLAFFGVEGSVGVVEVVSVEPANCAGVVCGCQDAADFRYVVVCCFEPDSDGLRKKFEGVVVPVVVVSYVESPAFS
jgi:hypothetical protein